jgi:hypothetical protein
VRLLNFVTAMEQGDGEFVNFIDSAGRLNRDAPSSRQSMSYWAARSIWALGEAVRVLGPSDSTLLTTMRPVLRRAIARMANEIEAERLIGGSTTATSEALLGLLAAQTSRDSSVVVPLATRTAQLLAQHSEGGSAKAPWGAYVDRPNASWHAWGARSPEALAIAGRVLKHPEFIASARKEADGLWGRFLLAGGMPSQVAPTGTLRGRHRSPTVSGRLSRDIWHWRRRQVSAATPSSRDSRQVGCSAQIPLASRCTTRRAGALSMVSTVRRRSS